MPLDLATPEQMLERLERVIADSPADATAITWLEARRGREATGKRRRDGSEQRERTLLVRVRERGRTGYHRTGEAAASDLAAAIREALAQARLNPPAAPLLEPSNAPIPIPDLFDEEIAHLDATAARGLLQRLAGRGESVQLGWVEGRIAVVTSAGVRRAVRATAATLAAGRRRPGGGWAAGAARSLAALDAAAILERAAAREGPEDLADLPPDGAPLLLSPDAAAALLDAFNRLALSSTSFHEGTSPLRGRLGEPVLGPALHLRDDGTHSAGLPFPFDLLGAAKRPVDLISGGVFLTPALDPLLAAELGRPATPHAISPDEALATNLFLRPGDRSEEELARELGDGALWIGALEPLECFGPLYFRGVARGVRRLESGALGRSLPDLVWEDGLTEVLTRILATASRPVTLPGPDPLLGGISTPALALSRAAALRPLGETRPW